MRLFTRIRVMLYMLRRYFVRCCRYCIKDVWNETRSTWWINLIKTVNLSVNSFLDKNLQQKACALTYSTILAMVPVLAMIFAIGRGFGFQNIVESEIFKFFPLQSDVLASVMSFVDSYLAQSSEGVFLGIGIVFLLWSLISLLGNVEDAFNHIWGEKRGRTFYRKVTDYTAIFMILPILMICSNGITIFMSVATSGTFLSPMVGVLLDIAPVVLIWMFFTGAFILIPNTRVKFISALIPGILCGSVFQIVQWLFVTGQIYVSKYNAIYGSFAFLPLLLIWIQLSWLICLSGVVITYSSQNIFRFSFRDEIRSISQRYKENVTIIVLAVAVRRFGIALPALTKAEFADECSIPVRLVGKVIDELVKVKLLSVVVGKNEREYAYQPAFDIELMTIGSVVETLRSSGCSSFIEEFDKKYELPLRFLDDKLKVELNTEMLIKDIFITNSK